MVQLLESYRNAQGQPRHRVVLSLGAAPLAEKDWQGVARAVSARLYGQAELSVRELSDHARPWVDSITRRVTREGRWPPLLAAVADSQSERLDGVLIDRVSHSQAALLGPVLIGWHAWQALALPQALCASWG